MCELDIASKGGGGAAICELVTAGPHWKMFQCVSHDFGCLGGINLLIQEYVKYIMNLKKISVFICFYLQTNVYFFFCI